MKKLIIISFLLGLWVFSTAQTEREKGLDIVLNQNYSNLTWSQFVQKVEQNYPVHFYFQFSNIPEFQISFDSDRIILRKVLSDHLLPLNIFASIDKKGNIFLSKNSIISTRLPINFFKTDSENEEHKQEKKEVIVDNNYIQTTKEFIAKTIIIGSKEEGINKRTAIINGVL